jgi:hypothetical protein
MGDVVRYLELGLPACATFGPFFLVIQGKDARRTQLLRRMGAVMIGWALVTGWLATSWQKGQIEMLQQRVEYLEARGR